MVTSSNIKGESTASLFGNHCADRLNGGFYVCKFLQGVRLNLNNFECLLVLGVLYRENSIVVFTKGVRNVRFNILFVLQV
jgi:hypothetical protein